MRPWLLLPLIVLSLLACGRQTSVLDLAVGHCFNTGDVQGVAEVSLLDCATAHDVEVFHVQSMPDGLFPGDGQVQGYADEVCNAAFAGYVGQPYEASDLTISYLFPTLQTWEAGDREVVCLLGGSEPLTGSMRGSNR